MELSAYSRRQTCRRGGGAFVRVSSSRLAVCEDGPAARAERIWHAASVAENMISVLAYDSRTGVIAPVEGGSIAVEIRDGSVEIFGDPAGLRDLARWCLALSDAQAPTGAHIHLDPGTIPLAVESVPLILARHPL